MIKLFKRYGAKVVACDKRDEVTLGYNALVAKEAGARLLLGENYLQLDDMDIVFRTPGMSFYMEELEHLREIGVVVTSEMELFFELCPCKIIAVTGSDGKTTTTTIISEFLKREAKTVHLGGNIGTPLLPEIERIKKDDIAVVELSSFQLISMRKSPDIAVVTNLSPNHLDIHKDMQEYVNAKKNIVLHQSAFDKAILNLNNEISNSFEIDCRGRVDKFSVNTVVNNGTYCDKDGRIFYSHNGKDTYVMNKSDIKIPGLYNVENYLAAIAAVWGIVKVDTIVEVAKTFNGVEHRAEFVREVNGVRYYNDSIASSPTRTALGTLSLYDFRIILIAGGYDKKTPYESLGAVINDKVKFLILMGNTASKIEKAVKGAPNYNPNNIKIMHVDNMEQAVLAASENAVSGDIVSMSPASASFDLYKNFDERGKHFKSIVNRL